MKRTVVAVALFIYGLALSFAAVSQTRFDHKAPDYVVPDMRVQLSANVIDPSGVKLARVYFKTPSQADYVFVPMTAAGGNRFVATVPAVNASAPSLQYVLLAVNNAGQVSKTSEYTVSTRRSSETPSWQSPANSGEMKVFTEAPTAPKTIVGFSDSISTDVVESTARFGAAAGLVATGGASGGAGAAGGASSTASAGGLSTLAIVGGVAAAAAVAAAAGGGGGGGSSSPPSYAGSWNAQINLPRGSTIPCQDTPEPFFLAIDAQNNVTVTSDGGTNPSTKVGANGAISGSILTIFWGTCTFSGTLTTNGTGSGNASCNGVVVPPYSSVCSPGQSGPWTATKF